jgi:hypothetical protein
MPYRISVRAALAVLVLFAAGSLTPSIAAETTWCGISNEGYANCGFATGEACRASVSGNGGYCMPPTPSEPHDDPNRAAKIRQSRQNVDKVIDRANRNTGNLNICRGC